MATLTVLATVNPADAAFRKTPAAKTTAKPKTATTKKVVATTTTIALVPQSTVPLITVPPVAVRLNLCPEAAFACRSAQST